MKRVNPDERYGRGTVITEITLTHRKRPWRGVLLHCDCGTLYEVSIYDLLREPRDGHYPIRSCGCLMQDKRSQGLSRSHELYGTWVDMMSRCYNPRVRSYRDYGARGITVCPRWHNAKNFIEDIERLLGPRPPGMTLDRTDNDSEYGPGKVRWATRVMQARNSRRYIDGTRHGSVYALWWRLTRRCPDEICPAWRSWPGFRDDIARLLGPRPAGMRFDRLDDAKPYGPGNVAWISGTEQVRRALAVRWTR